MNKKLQELADQAGFIFWTEEEDWGPGPGNIDWSADYAVELEKFAELIVEECCVALHPMLRDMISRGQGVDLIKKHFGINND
jgi:hypothetical protein